MQRKTVTLEGDGLEDRLDGDWPESSTAIVRLRASSCSAVEGMCDDAKAFGITSWGRPGIGVARAESQEDLEYTYDFKI